MNFNFIVTSDTYLYYGTPLECTIFEGPKDYHDFEIGDLENVGAFLINNRRFYKLRLYNPNNGCINLKGLHININFADDLPIMHTDCITLDGVDHYNYQCSLDLSGATRLYMEDKSCKFLKAPRKTYN